MVTCGESFNHYIQRDRKENHILITHGIYQIFRHPSYVGFYYWAVGTQLVLNNPISTILYAIAAWTFFRYRIAYEEETLRKLFPQEYESYAARTYIGIPFIRLALRLDDNNKKQQ
jgi:protein-S-isoprenylcysteine O-methyltransferase